MKVTTCLKVKAIKVRIKTTVKKTILKTSKKRRKGESRNAEPTEGKGNKQNYRRYKKSEIR